MCTGFHLTIVECTFALTVLSLEVGTSCEIDGLAFLELLDLCISGFDLGDDFKAQLCVVKGDAAIDTFRCILDWLVLGISWPCDISRKDQHGDVELLVMRLISLADAELIDIIDKEGGISHCLVAHVFADNDLQVDTCSFISGL